MSEMTTSHGSGPLSWRASASNCARIVLSARNYGITTLIITGAPPHGRDFGSQVNGGDARWRLVWTPRLLPYHRTARSWNGTTVSRRPCLSSLALVPGRCDEPKEFVHIPRPGSLELDLLKRNPKSVDEGPIPNGRQSVNPIPIGSARKRFDHARKFSSNSVGDSRVTRWDPPPIGAWGIHRGSKQLSLVDEPGSRQASSP